MEPRSVPIQRDHDVTALDALGASLQTLDEAPYGSYERLLQLAEMLRNCSALIWSLVPVIGKLERDVA